MQSSNDPAFIDFYKSIPWKHDGHTEWPSFSHVQLQKGCSPFQVFLFLFFLYEYLKKYFTQLEGALVAGGIIIAWSVFN